MLAKLETLLRENSLCVLCTEATSNPYCSLMTYLPSDDLGTLYLIATRESKKFKNLLVNPRVSVLVDSRQHPAAGANIVSVTFAGLFKPLTDAEVPPINISWCQVLFPSKLVSGTVPFSFFTMLLLEIDEPIIRKHCQIIIFL